MQWERSGAGVKYLRVDVEGCHINCDETLYTPLDPLTQYTEKDLLEIGQEMVNEHVGGWGCKVIDEDEVPEGDR